MELLKYILQVQAQIMAEYQQIRETRSTKNYNYKYLGYEAINICTASAQRLQRWSNIVQIIQMVCVHWAIGYLQILTITPHQNCM